MEGVNIFDIYSNSDVQKNIHNYEITHINIMDLVLNERNFYNTDFIEDLKESIPIQGLLQNLTVTEMEDGKFLILNGHRRYKALKALLDEGKIDVDTIPCVIVELTDLEQRTMLIMANKTARKQTAHETMLEINALKEIVVEVRKTKDESLKERLLDLLKNILKRDIESTDEIKGRTRDIVAEALNITSSEVAKFEAINNNLTDEVKEEFKDGTINTDVAYKTSQLKPEQQKEVKELIVAAKESNSKITAKDVDSIKEKRETPKKDSNNFHTGEVIGKVESFVVSEEGATVTISKTDVEEKNVSKLNTFEKVEDVEVSTSENHKTEDVIHIKEIEVSYKRIESILQMEKGRLRANIQRSNVSDGKGGYTKVINGIDYQEVIIFALERLLNDVEHGEV